MKTIWKWFLRWLAYKCWPVLVRLAKQAARKALKYVGDFIRWLIGQLR